MKLESGKYYHVYNRGNNSEFIFLEDSDYFHFIELCKVYLPSAFNILAYCLMKNHFHLCIQVREECELPFIDIRNKNSINNKWKIFLENDLEERYRKKIEPNSMIRFLFNSYAKWFNIKYSRTGSLFEKNFKRKIIEEDEYLKELIVYINTNPIKHSIVNKPELYEWTSYKEIINEQYVLINNQLVLDQFGSLENFKFVHENKSYK